MGADVAGAGAAGAGVAGAGPGPVAGAGACADAGPPTITASTMEAATRARGFRHFHSIFENPNLEIKTSTPHCGEYTPIGDGRACGPARDREGASQDGLVDRGQLRRHADPLRGGDADNCRLHAIPLADRGVEGRAYGD